MLVKESGLVASKRPAAMTLDWEAIWKQTKLVDHVTLAPTGSEMNTSQLRSGPLPSLRDDVCPTEHEHNKRLAKELSDTMTTAICRMTQWLI
jgi:hypothetical protein